MTIKNILHHKNFKFLAFTLGSGSALIIITLVYLFSNLNSFNITKNRLILIELTRISYKKSITWEKKGNILIGNLILKNGSQIQYQLSSKEISYQLQLLKNHKDINLLPCMDLLPLLNKKQLKNIYNILFKGSNFSSPQELIKLNDSLFLGYEYEEDDTLIKISCRIFYD
ncbi:hypothetical protein ABSA28_00034 [Candidatus Hepatincolaceae symbiont of Richtersius coronifer]